jgi:hypothetical protein
MRAISLFLFFSCFAIAQKWQPAVVNARFETRPYSGDLVSQVRQTSPAWYGYAVQATPGDRQSCCWNGSQEAGCYLEGNRRTVMTGSRPTEPIPLEAPAAIAVLFRVENNEVKKVQVYSRSCPLDAGGLTFVWITGVPEYASLSYLQKLTGENATDHVMDGAVLAISQHSSAQADTILEELTRPAQPEKVREKAIFWLGAERGSAGVSVLKRVLANDASDAVREKALFALSINKQPEALASLIEAAKRDGSPRVRGQALFWLAQKAGKEASSTIAEAVENDPDAGVKKQALFALSQLPTDEGVPKLIEAARRQKSPEVRKQAFFWLGQSRDPRALNFIEQVLTQ